jgi:hypothetical protein
MGPVDYGDQQVQLIADPLMAGATRLGLPAQRLSSFWPSALPLTRTNRVMLRSPASRDTYDVVFVG